MVGKGIPNQRNKPSPTCVHPELRMGGEKVLRMGLGLAQPYPTFSASPALPEAYTAYPRP